jgi:hypothetical protein
MIKPNTGRVVTGVADQHPSRDRPIGEFPCNAMGSDMLTVGQEPSVTSWPSNVLIGPTTRAFDNAGPEPLLDGSHSPGVGACAAAKTPTARPRIEPVTEFFVAVDTDRSKEDWPSHPSNLAHAYVCGDAKARV